MNLSNDLLMIAGYYSFKVITALAAKFHFEHLPYNLPATMNINHVHTGIY